MRSKNVILNIISNIILQIIIVIYGFAIPKIIISLYGSNINGLVSSITQFLSYIIFLEAGFGPVVKAALYKPIAKKDYKTIINILKTTDRFFKKIAFTFIIYIILLCFIYPFIINEGFDIIFTISLIVIIGISTFAEYFFGMTYSLFLQANQKSYVISFIQIFTYVSSIILIIILAKVGTSIQILKLISGIIFSLRPILLSFYVKRKYNINLKDANSNFELKQKWDGLAQHVASAIHTNTDITILTVFSNLLEVSVYSVYYLVVKGVKSLVQAFISGVDAVFGDMIVRKETENLNRKFSLYELLYNTVSTIAFSAAIILIVPFVSIYVKDIKDVNYIRYGFGVLLVISEFIWAIRQPYNELVKAAGRFKETKNGAWAECFVNIVISILLVRKFGLVGVTIGTLVAMTIRTIELFYYSNKYILNRSVWESSKKIILVICETIIIVLICRYLPYLDYSNYINWAINAILVVFVAIVVSLAANILLFRNELKDAIEIFKGILKRK